MVPAWGVKATERRPIHLDHQLLMAQIVWRSGKMLHLARLAVAVPVFGDD